MTIQDRELHKVSTGRSAVSSASARRSAPSAAKLVPTHEQIAARAKAIWQAKGCPVGKDEENWREAEAQLRAAPQGL